MRKSLEARSLDEACLGKNSEGTVLVDGLESACGELDADVAIELGNVNALLLEVRSHKTFVSLGDVATDSALFLGETRTVNFAANADVGTCD